MDFVFVDYHHIALPHLTMLTPYHHSPTSTLNDHNHLQPPRLVSDDTTRKAMGGESNNEDGRATTRVGGAQWPPNRMCCLLPHLTPPLPH